MAINLFEKQCDKIHSKYSSNSPRGSALVQLSIAAEGSITSSDSKSTKTKKKSNSKSPYLTGDSVQLLSKVTEKKLYSQHKKPTDIVSSSFPLAANIYKANSDEFKAQKKGIRKVKKSVLTLPNAPTTIPQTCTVSDMNDSEYFNGSDDNRKLKAKKRFAQNKKSRVRNKNYEFYDRDARYCSQMNISLDCSSTDMINQFTGDGKSVSGKYRARKSPQSEQEFNAHDVWAVLRNINRFQFRPSPPISEDSLPSPKKKKIRNRRRNNRVIETCRTEEFAYISSFEVDSKSPRTFSQSSSFDRITVIDKQDEFNEMCKEFEKRVMKTKNIKVKNQYLNTNKNQNRKNTTKNNMKAIGHKEQNEVNGPQLKKNHGFNKTRDIKANECQLKGNGYESPETLVSRNSDLKVMIPTKPYVDDFSTPDKFDTIKVIVNRSNEFDNSLGSESSKVEITAARKDTNNKLPKVSSDESGPHVKGITKVTLSKGQSLMQPKKIEIRKPRLATTMPTATITPKLTQTEIKRRLANLKFPIVILGKEQLSSATIKVMNNDPPNLEGLNQCIWPFMQDWYGQNNLITDHSVKDKKAEEKFAESNSPRNKHQAIERKNNQRKINEVNANKQFADKDKHSINIECTPNKKKTSKRPLPPNEISKMKPQQTKKPKPMHQFKDKMLKLLYKNNSAKDIEEQFNVSGQGETNHNDVVHTIKVKMPDVSKKVDVGTETFMKCNFVPNGLSRNFDITPLSDVKKMPIMKQPWAKAKWASDFIETVINKIRSGIYFNQESKQRSLKTDLKEASIQTLLSGKNFSINEKFVMEDLQSKTNGNEVAVYEANNYLKTLPGFDESLPALEIKTLNMKEVAVKYCTTNVMVQFDVSVPSHPENLHPLRNSSSFVPLAITESHTKIFKCKTTIVNAMLPAEICSLLPKIMQSIIDSNKAPLLPPAKFQSESPLYTISELGHCESPDIFKSALPPPMPTNISPTLLKFLDGTYCNKETCKKSNKEIPKVTYDINSIITKDVLVNVSVQLLFTVNINPLFMRMPKADMRLTNTKKYYENGISKTNTCTTLDLYRERNPVISMILSNNSSGLENLWKSKMNIRFIPSFPISLDVTSDHNKITFTLINNLNDDGEALMLGKTTVIGNCKIDSLYNGFMKHNNTSALKAIEYKKHAENKEKNNKIQNHTLSGSSKTRKKSFVRLYKKCKSTSNISAERYSTSLSKIINLDDFFQALGSGKLLSSVFDGASGNKILSSIIEMRNWITDISQRQAMLVLLLTNKKDTPNLVRFRPILLQGIAVNRITRASELDMEIEVIEREHFNKFSQFKGIPCLKESVENQNSLMKELYWIAKTTASDYQRPFNEASEKLLKSLLEKRKKLNPSYLRVMARYVGLGLLKCPKN